MPKESPRVAHLRSTANEHPTGGNKSECAIALGFPDPDSADTISRVVHVELTDLSKLMSPESHRKMSLQADLHSWSGEFRRMCIYPLNALIYVN